MAILRWWSNNKDGLLIYRVLPMPQLSHSHLHSSHWWFDLIISVDYPSFQAVLIIKRILVIVFSVELLWSHSVDPFFAALSVRSHLFLRWLGRVLIWTLPVALSRAELHSGSAAPHSSPQGCNHLQHHLLITQGCLDYHTMFNGKLADDEYCNTQQKHCDYSLPF